MTYKTERSEIVSYFEEVKEKLDSMSDEDFFNLIDSCINKRNKFKSDLFNNNDNNLKFTYISDTLKILKGNYKGKIFVIDVSEWTSSYQITFVDEGYLT